MGGGTQSLHNAVAALAIAYALGLNLKQAVADLENFPGSPRRLERIYAGQPFEVIVDYAPTDEALRQTLEALRPLYQGRIITVFGCGGNRDQLKRPRMTQVAMEGSDYSFATSDNPRRERIEDIFTQMKVGAILGKPIEWIADRRQAIAGALEIAGPGDCVLIAGKGHESYQEFSDAIVPFDDRKVAREVLEI
jgi:UDP-N-acetylmuramoyl-L-alanyl-D-glutamate--2,6-diaminopimelate ligase